MPRRPVARPGSVLEAMEPDPATLEPARQRTSKRQAALQAAAPSEPAKPPQTRGFEQSAPSSARQAATAAAATKVSSGTKKCAPVNRKTRASTNAVDTESTGENGGEIVESAKMRKRRTQDEIAADKAKKDKATKKVKKLESQLEEHWAAFDQADSAASAEAEAQAIRCLSDLCIQPTVAFVEEAEAIPQATTEPEYEEIDVEVSETEDEDDSEDEENAIGDSGGTSKDWRVRHLRNL